MINSYPVTRSMGLIGRNRKERDDSDRGYKLPSYQTKEVKI